MPDRGITTSQSDGNVAVPGRVDGPELQDDEVNHDEADAAEPTIDDIDWGNKEAVDRFERLQRDKIMNESAKDDPRHGDATAQSSNGRAPLTADISDPGSPGSNGVFDFDDLDQRESEEEESWDGP